MYCNRTKENFTMGDGIKQLVGEYSNYLKVDISSDVCRIEDSIDETLTRLEEFQNVLEMVRANSTVDATSSITSKRNELMALCEKVIFLETLTHHVKQCVDKTEVLVLEAETHVKSTTEGKIRSILKPFFSVSKKKPEVPQSPGKTPRYTPPEIFNTDQFFVSANQADGDSNR